MRALLPVLLLLAGCGGPTAQQAQEPLTCPDRSGLAVPAEPTAETTGRLVPAQAPDAALVCRYEDLVEGQDEARLAEQTAVTGLAALPADLALPGGAQVDLGDCDSGPGPVTPYLLGLAYPDGVVWVATRAQADPCRGATNGRFASGEDVGDVLAASAAAGRWTVPPLPDAEQRCVPARTGRLAQAGSLLPQGVVRLTLCRVAGDGVTRRTATAQELAEVQDVLSEPVAVPRGPRACSGGEQHELAAEYAEGRAVLVAYGSGCDPDVDNGSLQADLAPAQRARLEAVLR